MQHLNGVLKVRFNDDELTSRTEIKTLFLQKKCKNNKTKNNFETKVIYFTCYF